jgi:hypothetical protein
MGWNPTCRGHAVIDVTTKKPLRISTDGTAGQYIMVPLDQLPSLRDLLDKNRIRYTVHENAISLDGRPYIAVVNLGRAGNAKSVQAILDMAG